MLAVQRERSRIAGLVLVGASWQRAEAGSTAPLIGARRRDYTGALRSFIDDCLPETDSAELRHWALQLLSRASVDDAIELLRSREGIVPPPRMPRLAPPTLLIHGNCDRIVPVERSKELGGQIERAELEVLPGLGHVPIVTAAADVAGRIDAFVARWVAGT